jgi:DivIVA domain-containing protein
MELERGQIQRRDFPQARKGYDPQAVDTHLRTIADEVEGMKNAQPAQSSLAGTAASRVEAIVAAAEASAREIEERAHSDAEEIRARAEQEAAARVKGAQDSIDRLVDAAQALQREIDDVVGRIATLRDGVEAIQADVESASRPAESTAAARASGTAAAPVGPIHPEPAPEPPAPVIVPEEEPEPEPEPEPEAEPETLEPRPKPGADGERASEGARLIALNMALSGTSREETARYLRENFELADPDALLDEVYAKVGS